MNSGPRFPMRPLGELATSHDALRRPVKASDRRKGPYPYYGAQGIVDFVDGYLFDGEYVLVAEDGENLRSRKEPIAALARGKFWVNNHAHILSGSATLDTRFLLYAVNSTEIAGYITGSTIPKLSQTNLNRLPLPCPPIRIQRQIVSVLSALDDKIDLNRRMNETLEAMARAIFKDWFVDFGPTRAKAEGRSSYLDDEKWALFPPCFTPEGLPDGWRSGTLTEFAALNPESWTRQNFPEKIEYADLSGTKWGAIAATEIFAKGDAPSRAQRVLRRGDTVVGTVRPGNGSFAMVDRQGLTGSTGFAVLRPERPSLRDFVYFAATDPLNVERLARLADGGAYPAVRPEVVLATEVNAPPSQIVEAFHALVAPLVDKIQSNNAESSALGSMRDFLLPKLMAGEVSVRDADKALASSPS